MGRRVSLESKFRRGGTCGSFLTIIPAVGTEESQELFNSIFRCTLTLSSTSHARSFVMQILSTPDLPLGCCLMWKALGEEEI